MVDSRLKGLVDRLVNGIVTNEVMPTELRNSISRKQVAEYLGISLIEAGVVRTELSLIVARARLKAIVD
tara:strand:- start:1638 stop:1844 length:207 start_codon:yes stop_codon:yes gene_type:complete